MRRLLLAFAATLAVAAAAGAQAPPLTTGLNVGDLAPDFTLAGSDGKTYRLADFRGVRPVVVAWFPKLNATL